MKRTLFFVALTFVLLVGTAQAGFITDSYRHPLDADVSQRSADFIGPTPPFDIKGSEWTTSPTSNTATLNIYTDWGLDLGLGGTYSPYYWKVQLGDVFIKTTEGKTFGVALRDHVLEGDGITAGTIYEATNTYTSDWYYGLSGGKIVQVATSHYGDNEIVTGYGSTDNLGTASIAIAANGTGNPGANVITIQFADSTYANDSIRIATTCGNDIHDVPEPATLLFLGLGFVGAAVYGRYRRRENG